MSASFSGQVNQQLYHAGLLAELINSLDSDAFSYRAQKLALEQSITQAMNAAYRLFLLEIAQACQLRQQPQSLKELQTLLDAEQRSHAVVETLASLEADVSSWLSQLLQAQQKLYGAVIVSQPRAVVSDLLAVTDVTAESEQQRALTQFKQFVAEQREFLQEW